MKWLSRLLPRHKKERVDSDVESDFDNAVKRTAIEDKLPGQLLEQLPRPVIEPKRDRIVQISDKLDRLREDLQEHDGYVRQNVAKEVSVQNIRQVLGQMLGQVPAPTEQILGSLERITGKHKEILNILMHLEEWENLTYGEIAERMHCSPSRVRSYVSDLKNIGVELEMTKVGKKSAVRLNKKVLGQLLGQEGTKPGSKRAETEQ